MIKNQILWDKVKNLTGTEEEIKKLDGMVAEKKLGLRDYWIIRAEWARNKSINK